MRLATLLAARRRGWVWPMSWPRTWPSAPGLALHLPRPSASAILGNCVVLPEPVAPQTITTWCRASAAMISSRWPDTGSAGGNSICNGVREGGGESRAGGGIGPYYRWVRADYRTAPGRLRAIIGVIAATSCKPVPVFLGPGCRGRQRWPGSSILCVTNPSVHREIPHSLEYAPRRSVCRPRPHGPKRWRGVFSSTADGRSRGKEQTSRNRHTHGQHADGRDYPALRHRYLAHQEQAKEHRSTRADTAKCNGDAAAPEGRFLLCRQTLEDGLSNPDSGYVESKPYGKGEHACQHHPDRLGDQRITNHHGAAGSMADISAQGKTDKCGKERATPCRSTHQTIIGSGRSGAAFENQRNKEIETAELNGQQCHACQPQPQRAP